MLNKQLRAMALLGICHRTIRTVQRPQNKAFLLRKPLPTDPASFGERFRVARVANGYTQTEMGRKFGVSLSTIKFWEQNRTQPHPSVRADVEAFLKGVLVTTFDSSAAGNIKDSAL
jgi:DNA-binding XRE family transcriptional regulator